MTDNVELTRKLLERGILEEPDTDDAEELLRRLCDEVERLRQLATVKSALAFLKEHLEKIWHLQAENQQLRNECSEWVLKNAALHKEISRLQRGIPRTITT